MPGTPWERLRDGCGTPHSHNGVSGGVLNMPDALTLWSLAVLGPPRMDYQHTITAVSYIARLFDKILNESE